MRPCLNTSKDMVFENIKKQLDKKMKFLRKPPEIGIFGNFHMFRCYKKNSTQPNSTKCFMITLDTMGIKTIMINTWVVGSFFKKNLKNAPK